jgi:hypothetical protein
MLTILHTLVGIAKLYAFGVGLIICSPVTEGQLSARA